GLSFWFWPRLDAPFQILVPPRTFQIALGGRSREIGTSEASGFGIEPAQEQPGKPNFKLILVSGLEAHRPSGQARADKEVVLSPVGSATFIDSTGDHAGIVQLLDPTAIGTSRMSI